MTRRVLYYLLIDAITDLRAWLWNIYADYGQSIAIIEADARAALKRLGET